MIKYSCGDPNCSPCHNSDYESNDIAFAAKWLLRHKGKGLQGVFIDVGAHTGLWSLKIRKVYQRLEIAPKIIAFEPDPNTFESLKRNLFELKDVAVVRAAISNQNGVLYLNDELRPAARSVSRTNTGRPVRALTLDFIFGDLIIDMIKVDVEGHEYEALKGAEQILSQASMRLLMIEWFLQKQYKHGKARPKELLNLLNKLNYHWIPRRQSPLLHRNPKSVYVEAFEKPA